jgi:hypothetical protein
MEGFYTIIYLGLETDSAWSFGPEMQNGLNVYRVRSFGSLIDTLG